MRDSNVADAAKESAQAEFPHGLLGLRIGYDALDGSYMYEQPFLDLIRAGYIGAYSDTIEPLAVLVNAVLEKGKAVVVAIQTRNDDASDDEIRDGS
jgi:hypothetical protein